MKKTTVLIVIIILSLIITGCKSPVLDVENSNELNTYVYGETENSSIFYVSEKDIARFDSFETKDNNANDTISVKILNKIYNGVYDITAQLPCSDTIVDVYKLQGTEKGTVFVDRNSNKIVEYTAIPYDDKLVTEKDYIGFIKKIIGDGFDVSEYEYKCKTQCITTEEGGITSRVVDGFKVSEGNMSVRRYHFFYTKSIEGIELQDHISAGFYNGLFNLEVYKSNYNSEKVYDVLNRMSEIEEKVQTHLRNNVKEGCDILDVKHVKKQFFIKDGKPYLLISSVVTYKSQYSEKPYEISIKTITG